MYTLEARAREVMGMPVAKGSHLRAGPSFQPDLS